MLLASENGVLIEKINLIHMKKVAFVILSLLSVQFASAQNFDLSILDKAMGLINKGDNAQGGGLLNDAIAGITKEVGGSKTSFTPKITSQLGSLGTLASGLSSGGGNTTGLSKIINTIKTLVAANRLKNMLGGSSSLLGKGKAVGENTNLLSKSLGLLGGSSPQLSQATDLLSAVSKNSSKLDGSSVVAKGAEKLIKDNLGSSLGIIEKLF